MANKFDDLLKAVNDRYKGKYMALASDTSAFAMERLPTGILAVDAITYGGLPKGRIIIFWGEWSAAKTFTALKAVARTQRTCRKCATFMADNSTETTLIDQSTGEILLTSAMPSRPAGWLPGRNSDVPAGAGAFSVTRWPHSKNVFTGGPPVS